MPMTAEQLEYTFQERLDDALMPIGERAPPPVMGHSPDRYRRRSLITMKNALPEDNELRRVRINGDLSEAALDALEPQIITSYIAERRFPSDLQEGELRPQEIKNEYGHIVERRFLGRDNFVKFMGRPGRRVVSFLAPVDASGRTLHPINASGRFLR